MFVEEEVLWDLKECWTLVWPCRLVHIWGFKPNNLKLLTILNKRKTNICIEKIGVMLM
jgi:hypothetical protein